MIKKVSIEMIILLMLVSMMSACGSSNSYYGYSYERNVPSIKEAIRNSLTALDSPAPALGVIDNWISRINTKKLVDTPEEQKMLLAQCYRYKADAYSALGIQDLALETYNLALANDPSDMDTYFNRACLYSNSYDRHDEISEELTYILSKKPDFADAYLARGKTFEKQQKYVEAIIDYNKAVSIEPNNQVYSNYVDVAYMELYKTANIVEDATKLINLFPNEIQAYELRAAGYYMNGQYNEALFDYLFAYTQTFGLSQAVLVANCYSALGEYNEAVNYYTIAIEKSDPHNTGLLHSSRGQAYASLQNYSKALADQQKAIELLPNNPVPYFNRGELFAQMEEYEKAIVDYTSAIEQYSAAAYYYERRGNAYAKLNQNDKAENDFARAEELESVSIPAQIQIIGD